MRISSGRVICRSWKNIQGEGGSLVSFPPPPICPPQFLNFPLDGAGRTGSASYHPPLTPEGWPSTWTSQKSGPTCVQLPSSLRNVVSA